MGLIDPWTDENELYIRTVTKSTLLAWAANISVPADKWKGVQARRLADGRQRPAELDRTRGRDRHPRRRGLRREPRDTLSVLAFRAQGPVRGVLPDSTSTSRDKKNVRDGHYTVWSPTVWMDTIDPTTHVPVECRHAST